MQFITCVRYPMNECILFIGFCVETCKIMALNIVDRSILRSIDRNTGNTELQLKEKTKNQCIPDALSALVYIHSKNMVHRDIKSKNVMLYNDRTRCKLTVFGLALKDDTETNSTVRDHGFAGMEKYCPKEVIDGQRLTVDQLKCIDIYSLALTTFDRS